MKNFYDSEFECTSTFEALAPFWHLWTPEDHEIIFSDAESFKAGMIILAISAKLTPSITIITFELMTNHLHITAAGAEDSLLLLFDRFKRYLASYLKTKGAITKLERFNCKTRQLDSIEDVRNVIVYNNRNGYVVSPDHTPFSFPWGANSYYFNPAAQRRFMESRDLRMTQKERRSFIRSHDSDTLTDSPRMLDGYACPMDFCFIHDGERLFRNASHYFRELSKNVESQKAIAAEIGERFFYNDDELFAAVQKICRDKYGQGRPATLSSTAKTEMAKLMRYEYNAGNKQIARILKLDINIVKSLFPPLPQ